LTENYFPNWGEVLLRLKQLKSNQYDLVLDFQGLFRSGFFSWITGAPVKIGFNDAREMATYFYTHKVISQDDEHIVDAMWRFGYLLDFVSYDKDFTIDFTHAHELQAKTILENNNLEANQYIVLLIGGTAASKRWPVEMFSALAKRLSDVNKISIVLIGAGDTETALATTFMSNCQSNVSSNLLVNLVNQTSIPEAALIMKQSLLVCGNDSGPLHIADSFDLPLISIYGPTNPKVVGPYRHMNTVLVSGNNQIRAQRYSQHEAHKIVNINVDDVYNTVINQLGITHEKADDDC
jgi:heptosyltransferase-1